ncbi:hypothetical protein AAMO2058_001756800, partial [Amorphochlora amoebiformis]
MSDRRRKTKRDSYKEFKPSTSRLKSAASSSTSRKSTINRISRPRPRPGGKGTANSKGLHRRLANMGLHEDEKGSRNRDKKGTGTAEATGRSRPSKEIQYTANSIIGKGSFGVVYKATVTNTEEVVAIKKVLQDRRFKNRELEIMRMMRHPNVVELKHSFYAKGEKDDLYLNLVMEYVPITVHHHLKSFFKIKK